MPWRTQAIPRAHSPLCHEAGDRLARAEGVEMFTKANSAPLSYIIAKHWAEILKMAMDELRPQAEEEFKNVCTGHTTLHGSTVSLRTVATKWKYTADIESHEKYLADEQAALKQEKKRAEEDWRARAMWKKKGLVVAFGA